MNTHTVIVPEQEVPATPASRRKRLLLMDVVALLAVRLGLTAYLHGNRYGTKSN